MTDVCCTGVVCVNGYLIQNLAVAREPLAPALEEGSWYFFYFLTERGRKGLRRNREDLAGSSGIATRLKGSSPRPSSRRRRGCEPTRTTSTSCSTVTDTGSVRPPRDPRYADLEVRLLEQSKITVPAVTLDGQADGVLPSTDGSGCAARFTGPWRHHVVLGAAGHNLPQERSDAFTAAVVEVAAMG